MCFCVFVVCRNLEATLVLLRWICLMISHVLRTLVVIAGCIVKGLVSLIALLTVVLEAISNTFLDILAVMWTLQGPSLA